MERNFRCVVLTVATVLLSFPLAALAWLDPTQPDVVTVLDSEDNRFSAISSEIEYSYGATSSSRIKGNQDLMGLKFDLSAYRGRMVEQAELHSGPSRI